MDKQKSFNCPECDNQIKTSKEIKKGIIVECSACGVESEFISISPVKLAPLEEEK